MEFVFPITLLLVSTGFISFQAENCPEA